MLAPVRITVLVPSLYQRRTARVAALGALFVWHVVSHRPFAEPSKPPQVSPQRFLSIFDVIIIAQVVCTIPYDYSSIASAFLCHRWNVSQEQGISTQTCSQVMPSR